MKRTREESTESSQYSPMAKKGLKCEDGRMSLPECEKEFSSLFHDETLGTMKCSVCSKQTLLAAAEKSESVTVCVLLNYQMSSMAVEV